MSDTQVTYYYQLDSSGREYIHSTQLVEFFLFLFTLLLLIAFLLRTFKFHKFYTDPDTIPQKQKQEVDPYVIGDSYDEDLKNIDKLENISPELKNIKLTQELAPKTTSQNPQETHIKLHKSQTEHFSNFFEDMIMNYLPFASILLLNICNFGCYIFCAFTFMGWILSVALFNKFKLLGNSKWQDLIHLFFVLALFINYFVNDQIEI